MELTRPGSPGLREGFGGSLQGLRGSGGAQPSGKGPVLPGSCLRPTETSPPTPLQMALLWGLRLNTPVLSMVLAEKDPGQGGV